MPATKLIKPSREVSFDGEDLVSELHQLLMLSIGNRNDCGATFDIQNAYMRGSLEKQENSLPEYPVQPSPECSCEGDESCDLCDESLVEICSTEQVSERLEGLSPFAKVAQLISTIKVYDYISLAEHAYASIGNKPFKLKSNKEIEISDADMNELASLLTANIEAYLVQNDIRVNEIPEAFDFVAMADLIKGFEDFLLSKASKRNQEMLTRYEDGLERIFNRTEFMQQYLECIKDTGNYPIGVLWIDDHGLKKTKRIDKNGNVALDVKIQSSVERVHPSHIWFTPDFSLSDPGRAVFRIKRFTRGDIHLWKEMNVAGSEKLNRNITKFLEQYEEGGFIPYTMLFRNLNPVISYDYDIMIARGLFSKKKVEELGIEIPAVMKNENYVPCEIYFSGDYILRVTIMNVLDKRLGVFTTVFRRNCDSIYGYSVHDFCYPFAKLYMGVIDGMDRNVGKAMGMIIQVDTAVILDPEKYFRRDASGNIVLDITEDNLIEFNSLDAAGAPNFKGFPITVTQIPSNLDKLIPMLNIVVQEMERVTKIPNMLTDGSDISSALRTTSNFNMAFKASAKVIQALLRESENRLLKPAIKYMFDSEILNRRVPSGLLEIEPEILLSDTLVREKNDGAEMLQNFAMLQNYRDMIPPQKFAALLNTIARDVFGYKEDLIPDAGVFTIQQQPDEQTVA